MNYTDKMITVDYTSFDVNENIVFCYGHFNLIHPGHLRYLQHAKTLADRLVVVVRSDKDLNRDAREEFFTETERAESVANLQIVDNVVILNKLTLEKLIKAVKPSVLLLGREFELEQSNQIRLAISAVKKQGKVIFHAGETHYSTTNLLHGNVVDIEIDSRLKMGEICKNYRITKKALKAKLNNFSEIKLAVIGDTIVDNYVACDALGMSAEAPVLVVKELENCEFIGGAAIVASHVCALESNCHYISVVGNDEQGNLVKNTLDIQGVETSIFVDESRPTTYKTRYMVESHKLFRVSKVQEHKVSEKIEQKIIEKLTDLAPDLDGILVSDFVYGVVTQNILNAIIELSKKFNIKLYGDLQCSSQVGKVSKFKGFDLITPTEKESRVALDDNESGIEWVANTLLQRTKSKNMLIKLGPNGFIAYNDSVPMSRQDFPALSINPVDVTGAGDSLFAAMSVSLSSGASLMEASVIGSFMASLAVTQVGNVPIKNKDLSEYISKLLE